MSTQINPRYISPDPTNTTNISVGIESIYAPVTIYIIICFFCVLAIIIYRSSAYKIPSISTMTLMSLIMLTSCAALTVLANISIAAQWGCLFIATLGILFVTYAILIPTVFFYPKLS
jgi:hypothetical protein